MASAMTVRAEQRAEREAPPGPLTPDLYRVVNRREEVGGRRLF